MAVIVSGPEPPMSQIAHAGGGHRVGARAAIDRVVGTVDGDRVVAGAGIDQVEAAEDGDRIVADAEDRIVEAVDVDRILAAAIRDVVVPVTINVTLAEPPEIVSFATLGDYGIVARAAVANCKGTADQRDLFPAIAEDCQTLVTGCRRCRGAARWAGPNLEVERAGCRRGQPGAVSRVRGDDGGPAIRREEL